MKRKAFNFSVVSIPLVILYLILSKGVIVKPEFNTGPELVVITGQSGLKSKGTGFDINSYERAYTTYPLYTDYGFKSIGTSFAFYKIIGSEPTEDLNKRAAVLEITTFYPILLIAFLIFTALFLYALIVKRLSKIIFVTHNGNDESKS